MEKDVLSYTGKKSLTAGTKATSEKKSQLAVPPANESLYLANLEGITPNLKEFLSPVATKEIAIEDEIIIGGLNNPTFLVIIGFSTTKILEAALKTKKNIQNILIIEPDLGILKQTLMRSWVAEISKEKNVELLLGVGPEQMMPHLYRIFTFTDKKGNRANRCKHPEIIVDPFAYPPVNDKPQEIVDQITKLVVKASDQVFLSMGCASDSFFRYEQMTRNEKALESTYRIEPLFDKFKDMPIFVLGGGPSLQGFIDMSCEYKLHEFSLVIACDASLPKLLKYGIKPHIVTRCERKLTKIFQDLKYEDTKDIFYAAYPWCPPEYFNLFQESFMLFRGNGVCNWSGFKPGEVNGGVSSANAALELAFLLGGKEIILAGVDLCFIDGKSHTPGTEVEFDVQKSKPKWSEIPGNSGPVTTIPVWYRCLNEYLTTLTKYNGQAKVYNTSLNGAKIEGTTLVSSFDELAKRLSHDNKNGQEPTTIIRHYLEKHTPHYMETYKKNKHDSITYLKEAKHELEKLLGNVEDLMLIAGREEARTLNQLKGYPEPYEFYLSLEGLKKSLGNVYREPNRQIDGYKQKYFTNRLFNIIVLDTIQADFFTLENKLNALQNTTRDEHDRLKSYTVLNLVFLRTVEYFLSQFINLFENGAKQDLDYEKLLLRADI